MSRLTKAEKQQIREKREQRLAEANAIVATGVCPNCGRKLRRNLSLWLVAMFAVWGRRVPCRRFPTILCVPDVYRVDFRQPTFAEAGHRQP